MQAKTELKNQTQEMLKNFKNTEKVDFQTLSKLAEEFGVKSILLITSSANQINLLIKEIYGKFWKFPAHLKHLILIH